MVAVPNKLLLQILRYVSKKDLKAVRLTRVPQLYTCASSLLFTTAYVSARRGVLEAFKNLTTHPVFCHYVKEVIFDSSWISPASVAQQADHERGHALAHLFAEQENIQANELQISLENAFKCLSNVTKVSYADLSRISYLPGDRNDPAWGGKYSKEPLIRRLECDLGPAEVSYCCIRSEPNAGCPSHDDKFLYRRKFGGLISLLQVLSNHASTQLLQLSLGDIAHSSKYGGIPFWFLWLRLSPPVKTIHSFANIFYNLRKFDLSVSWLEQLEPLPSHRLAIERVQSNWHSGNLAKILCFAENLEELKLAGSLQTFLKISVESAFATHTWSRLNTICLKSFSASAGELEDFLKRHSHSLRSMTLDDFDLTSGCWLEFERIIPTISPRLSFILGSVSEDRQSVSAHALLPLPCKDLAVSGPKHDRYAEENRDEDEDEEGTEEEGTNDWGSFEELEYCSDDDSSKTSDIDPSNHEGSELQIEVRELQEECLDYEGMPEGSW